MSSASVAMKFSTLLGQLRAALVETFGGWEGKSPDDREEMRRAGADIVEIAEVSFLSSNGMSCSRFLGGPSCGGRSSRREDDCAEGDVVAISPDDSGQLASGDRGRTPLSGVGAC